MPMRMRDFSGGSLSFGNRLCARRILGFLKDHCLDRAAHQLEGETAVFFDLYHLRWLAMSGRWDELTTYVDRFLSHVDRSAEAIQFLHLLNIYSVLGIIARGGRRAALDIDACYPLLDDADAKERPHIAKMHAFFHHVRRHPPEDYATWMKIWETAAEKLKELALKCPEIKAKLQLPRCAPKTRQINLCGVQPVLRPRKKKPNKPEVRHIACFFEGKRQEIKKRLTGFSSNETSHSVAYRKLRVLTAIYGFSSLRTIVSKRSEMQTEPPVPQAAGKDSTDDDVGSILGVDQGLGSEEEDASRSMKRQMNATPGTDRDDNAGSKKSRKESSSPL